MTFDEIRAVLARRREERGWSLETAARKISAIMQEREPDRRAAAAAGGPRLRSSISRGGLFNWEAGRSRPTFEDLDCWSAALGMRAVYELALREGGPAQTELLAVHERLSSEDRHRVLLYARLLSKLEGVPLEMLRGYVDMAAARSDSGARSAG